MEVDLEMHAIRRPRRPHAVREAARIQYVQRLAEQRAQAERVQFEQAKQIMRPQLDIERQECQRLQNELEMQRAERERFELQQHAQIAIDLQLAQDLESERQERQRLQNELGLQRAENELIEREAEIGRQERQSLQEELEMQHRKLENAVVLINTRNVTTDAGARIEYWGVPSGDITVVQMIYTL